MDENDKQDPDARALITEKSAGNGHNHTYDHKLKARLPAPTRRMQDLPSTSSELWAWRRTRLNRLLIRKRRQDRLNRSFPPRPFVVVAIISAVLITILSTGAGIAYAYYAAQLPLLNGIAQHSLFQTTHIYDRNGNLLYELYDHQNDRGRRTYINYNDISQVLVSATIAAEDHTFWTNAGVDFYGIARATLSNVQHLGVVEGGSTITQQLIKNQFFAGQPRTLQVKTEEAILAAGLTQQYPKWKIMEMYLNTVYYGDLNYGVEAAAENFLQMQPKCSSTHCAPAVAQLDLAQASLLAGLPQSPSVYDPISNKDLAMQRQDTVLQSMLSLGMITQTQLQKAEAETAKMTFKSYSAIHHIQAPHFVQYVIDEVLEPLLGADALSTGGYNIYTTLDLKLENKVEQIVRDDLYGDPYGYGSLSSVHNVNDAAVVVIDPFNGEILAMDGSADYNKNTPTMQGQFNAATALRQPGSSIKPVIYSTAFEMGWYPAMIIQDQKTVYPGNTKPPYYAPRNYDGNFHGALSVRTAIANSYNIPAIDALEFAGIPNVLNLAGRLGLTELASKPLSSLGPSMAIGSEEVSLLHMTSAYATFANQGVRVPPTSVLEITDNEGHPIYKFDPSHPAGSRVMRQDVAFLMTSILSDKSARYREFAPGNPLELDRPAAAKTGTTDSFRDNWTMGYTPYLSVGVWAGNSDNSKMNNVIGITGAGPIWHDVIEYASHLYNYPSDDFIKPADVHAGTVSALTGLLPYPGESTVTDWFIDGTMPTIGDANYYTPSPCTGDQCNTNPYPYCYGFICPPPR